jgi:hypothetical protein
MGGACSTYGEKRFIQGFVGKNLRERDHSDDPHVDAGIRLRWIFRKWNLGTWTGSIWLRIGEGGGHL